MLHSTISKKFSKIYFITGKTTLRAGIGPWAVIWRSLV